MTVTDKTSSSTAAPSRPKLSRADRFVDAAFASSVLPRRDASAHKWGIGGLVIVAGAPGYVGAAALSAMAAGRAGAGIVNLAVPRFAIGPISSIVPEAAFIPMPEGDADLAARRAIEVISEKLGKSRAILVGPGLSDDDHAVALLASLFGVKANRRESSLGFGVRLSGANADAQQKGLIGGDKPAVVDADALNWLATQESWWTSLAPKSLILTPHAGEMARLLGQEVKEVVRDPLATAKEAANRWKQIVVLKYGYSIATDGATALVAEDAPPSLATAGSGDVLAGTIGAFLAQGMAPLDAAGLALYVGPRAARRVEERTGTLGLVASDLPLAIAQELATLEAGGNNGNDHA